jgi:DNA-binding MarR family transcriptional regulator
MSAKKVKEVDLNEVLGLLHFGFREVVAEPDRLLARRGFSRVHHRILFFVARNRSLSVGQLLAILDVSKQALHRPLAQLREAGLIEALAAPENRRLKLLQLTKKGAHFEDQLSGLQRDRFAAAFADSGGEIGWRAVMQRLAPCDPFGRDRL